MAQIPLQLRLVQNILYWLHIIMARLLLGMALLGVSAPSHAHGAQISSPVPRTYLVRTYQVMAGRREWWRICAQQRHESTHFVLGCRIDVDDHLYLDHLAVSERQCHPLRQ